MVIKKIINRHEMFTIPNILSYFRILLIPIWIGAFYNRPDTVWPLMILVISGLTDTVDGYIARRFNQITEWGKVIDPVADKLTQLTVTICLAIREPIMWYVVLLFVLKDGFLALGSYILLKKTDKELEGAQWYGKVCTIMFYIIVGIMLLLPNINRIALFILVGLFEIIIITAFVLYIKKFKEIWKTLK